MTCRTLAFLLVSLISLIVLRPAEAIAQQALPHVPNQVELWSDLGPFYHTPQKDPSVLCRSITDGVIPVLDYMGANFVSVNILQNDSTKADCKDSNNNTHPIGRSCAIDFDNNGIFDPNERGFSWPCIPQYQCQKTVGDPVIMPSGVLIETAEDWISPKDSRFALRRTYRSDGALAHSYYYRGVYSHQGVWFSDFDEMLIYGPDGNIPDWTHAYFRHDGVIMPFYNPSQTSSGEYVGTGLFPGNPYRLVSNNGMKLSDPSGRTLVFRSIWDQRQRNLDEIIWPDGYSIKIERMPGALTRIDTVTDNKGQRLKYTWTTSPTPNSSAEVVSRIAIDSNFNGTSFQPDLAIDYKYRDNPYEGNLPMIDEVSRYDFATGQSEIVAKYDYETDPAKNYSRVPLLKATYDGRKDSQGQLIPFANFTYTPDLRLFPIATATGHSGGADGYSFTASPNNSEPTSCMAVNALGLQTTYSVTNTPAGPRISQISGASASNVAAATQAFDYTPTAGGPTGYLYAKTERNGSKTTYTRDARGLVLTKTEDATGPSPRVTTYTWGTTLRLPLTRTTSQLAEAFTYTPEGLLTAYSQTDVLAGSPSNGQTRTWTYNYSALASGVKVLTSLDGPGLSSAGINDVTTYTYDSEGKLTSTTDPNGLVTAVTAYNAAGQATTVHNPDDTEWQFTYDSRGRLTSSKFGIPGQMPAASTYSYDVVGQLLSSTNSLGKTWSFTYNSARRLTVATNPSGDKATYTYDLTGNVTKTEYSNGTSSATFWEDTQFDALGRLFKTIGANGQIWTFGHDVEDNLTAEADPQNLSTLTNYDALNRITSVVDREAYTIGQKHNDADLLTEYTDPRNLKTTFTYNGFGDVLSEVSPDRGTITYTYDSRGLVKSKTNALAKTINYVYDNGGRLKTIDYPGTSPADVTFTYDVDRLHSNYTLNRGYLGAVGRSGEIVDFKYDLSKGRNPNYIKYFYPGARTYQIYQSFDTEGNLLTITYPNSGTIVKYTYDTDNRIQKVAVRLAGASVDTILADQISYLPNGPVGSLQFGDGSVETRTYDNSYRLTGLKDVSGTTTLRNLTYGYNAHDNLTTISDVLLPANDQSFGYTPRESLASAAGPYGSYGFTYDGVGNRISHATPAGTETYAYPSTTNRLTSVTSASSPARTLTYNAAGNVVTDARGGSTYTYVYDDDDRIRQVKLNGVIQTNYGYNYRGQQILRTFPASGLTIQSVFGSDGNRISEHSQATGALIREYVWLDGAPLAVIEGGQVYLVRTDNIGRPSYATTMSGTQVWSASYLPFGGVAVSSGTPIDLRFPGQWFQTETGLYQNWMRDYDPTTGRYMEADPLGLVDGASVYGYARQNPGRYTDPRGEQLYDVVAGAAGADLVTPDRSDAIPLKWAGYGAAAVGAFAVDKIIEWCTADDCANQWEEDQADCGKKIRNLHDDCWKLALPAETVWSGVWSVFERSREKLSSVQEQVR